MTNYNTQNLSYIHPNAKIGKGVSIGPFCCIEEDVVIGDDCEIGANVNILNGSRIGKSCKIFPGAVIGGISQDLKYNGEYCTATIEDHVTIREYVTVNKGSSANSNTLVKSHTLLMAYCHVAHDCIVGSHCILANSVHLGGHVELGDWVIIGGIVGVHQFVKIGEHSMIAAGVLVRKDVPPFIKTGRDPLSYIGVNSIGLQRRGFDQETIEQIQDVYRILFVKGHSRKKAILEIENELPPSEEKGQILDFINGASRGIIKGLI